MVLPLLNVPGLHGVQQMSGAASVADWFWPVSLSRLWLVPPLSRGGWVAAVGEKAWSANAILI